MAGALRTSCAHNLPACCRCAGRFSHVWLSIGILSGNIRLAVSAKTFAVKRGIGALYGPGFVRQEAARIRAREFFPEIRFYGEIFHDAMA
jgi:uncharacterized membrane protein